MSSPIKPIKPPKPRPWMTARPPDYDGEPSFPSSLILVALALAGVELWAAIALMPWVATLLGAR